MKSNMGFSSLSYCSCYILIGFFFTSILSFSLLQDPTKSQKKEVLFFAYFYKLPGFVALTFHSQLIYSYQYPRVLFEKRSCIKTIISLNSLVEV